VYGGLKFYCAWSQLPSRCPDPDLRQATAELEGRGLARRADLKGPCIALLVALVVQRRRESAMNGRIKMAVAVPAAGDTLRARTVSRRPINARGSSVSAARGVQPNGLEALYQRRDRHPEDRGFLATVLKRRHSRLMLRSLLG
jgi:hypothetical protein